MKLVFQEQPCKNLPPDVELKIKGTLVFPVGPYNDTLRLHAAAGSYDCCRLQGFTLKLVSLLCIRLFNEDPLVPLRSLHAPFRSLVVSVSLSQPNDCISAKADVSVLLPIV